MRSDRHRDGKIGPHRRTAAPYDVMPPANVKLKPVGEWNHSRILVGGNHVEHRLKGVKVVAYEMGSDALKAAVAKSQFKSIPEFSEKFKTLVLIQDHGDELAYRNIKIRELPAK